MGVMGVTPHRSHILCGLCTRSLSNGNTSVTFGARRLSSERLPESNLINPHNNPPREGGLFSPFTDENTEGGELPEPAVAGGGSVHWLTGCHRQNNPRRRWVLPGQLAPGHALELGVGVRGAGWGFSLGLS